MSNIPLARERLIDICNRMERAGLQSWVTEIDRVVDGLMVRRSPRRKVAPKSPTMTPDMAQAIRDYAARFPQATQMEIATTFSVNAGRVSEALAHRR